LLECFDAFRLDVDVDEKNEHDTTIMAAPAECRQGKTATP
jgi:hypothetical protein